jgi:hypothetical protein
VVVSGHGVRRFFAFCAAAHSMISVDTGPAHAAAALSLPLVVLYGAESPSYWLPRSPSGSPVTGVGGPPVSTRADQVSVETVFEAWREMVDLLDAPARSGPKPSGSLAADASLAADISPARASASRGRLFCRERSLNDRDRRVRDSSGYIPQNQPPT